MKSLHPRGGKRNTVHLENKFTKRKVNSGKREINHRIDVNKVLVDINFYGLNLHGK